MNNVLILSLCIIALSSYVFLFRYKILASSPERRMLLLREVTQIAAMSVELRYPGEHVASRKKQATTLTYAMLREMRQPAKEHFVIDCLLDSHIQHADTDSRLAAVHGRMADCPTQRDIPAVRLQNTPSMGMRQVASRRTGGLST